MLDNTLGFLIDDLTPDECIAISNMVDDNISNNTIFLVDNNIPVVVSSCDDIPNVAKPLPMSKISFLSSFSTFLRNSKYGINVLLEE